MKTESAVFAAGCFWGVEAAFRQVNGVAGAQVGYTGGHTPDPTYEAVCSGRTGHAEAVEIMFDPLKISYEELVRIFFSLHDPTQINRQGPDIGTQYRSAVFYRTPEQKKMAEEVKKELEDKKAYRRPIATEIVPASTFYRAEEYHQRYLEKTGRSFCRGN